MRRHRKSSKLLGNHALAVDVALVAVDKLGYADFLKRLNHPGTDATDFAAKLSGELPTGHEKQIAATLLDSIKRLDESGLNFLYLAALLAPTPIPQDLVVEVFSRLSTDPELGTDQAILGMDAATWEALAERPPCVDDAPDRGFGTCSGKPYNPLPRRKNRRPPCAKRPLRR